MSPQGLSDGLIRKHTLLIEENSPTLSPEIDMDASYFPLTGFFNWNFYCDYPVLTQHYISDVLGEIVCLLHPGHQNMRHLSVLEKKAVRGPEMLDFELCFKIFVFKYVLF